MYTPSNESITLNRSCEAVEIPAGIRETLPAGSVVRVMQQLGGSYTVSDSRSGRLYRIEPRDADALGFTVSPEALAAPEGELTEEMIWKELKTIYDPEIPVNIADLGLIYSCVIKGDEQTGHTLNIRMSLTAPGCGMADVLKADVERKLARLPSVRQVNVEVVVDPPWNPNLMSEAARLQLGLDLDYTPTPPPSGLPIYRER